MSYENGSSRLVRVLVADGSAFIRTALTRMIESDPALRVSGTAKSGLEVLEMTTLLRPDVVTLDSGIPGLTGLEVLKRIMRDSPRPVIMVNSFAQRAEITLEALADGAFDCVPSQLSHVSCEIESIREGLIATIKAAAQACCPHPVARVIPAAASPLKAYLHTLCQVAPAVVALGTSTGGPMALQEILPTLPADLPVGVLIVQHMPPGFTAPLARRLDGLCKVSVREAAHDDLIVHGVVYIAPAGQHMTVHRRSSSEVAIRISHLPEGTLHTPSVDVLMLSVADVFQAACMGIILTGMGSDGLIGMQAIARGGGITVGQDAASCAVYGMPRVCAEGGILQHVVALPQIPQQILQATHYHRHAEESLI
jgi:two-component system chemotaxis response regulator CheB